MRPDPLIVTLTLDPAAQAHFDALRSAHFPPERLLVGAHVTLFHALPGEELDNVNDALMAAAEARSPFRAVVASVRFLGRGVAFTLQSAELLALRARLRQAWSAQLTPQDRAAWSPHVTIQNKVAPADARALFERLKGSFVPYSLRATGLDLWFYRDGPWEQARSYRFQD